MPSTTLVPNTDISDSNFTLSSGSDVYEMLNDDTSSSPTNDNSCASATSTNNTSLIVGFEDFDFSGVDSITSVQPHVKCNVHERQKTYSFDMTLRGPDNSILWDEGSGTINSGGFYTTKNFTARTTNKSVGGTAWTDSDLDNLRLGIAMTSLTNGGTFRVTYVYLTIVYVESTGYANDVIGVGSSNIAKINGILTADISKLSGI